MCGMCQGVTARELIGQVRDTILRRGWAIQYVESDGSRENPDFAYTVGLSRVDHPEFICFRMCPEHAGRSLNRLGAAVLAGRRFAEGDDLSDVFPGDDPGELLWFPDSSTHLYLANDFYRRAGGRPIPALQLYFPSTHPLVAGR
jgi:hypothetical protein